MKTPPKNLSYFTLRLQELLNISFPERSVDKVFIHYRSRLATNAYEGAFLAGNAIQQCDEIANYILFEGFHFSKFDTVFKVICNEFDTRIADEALRPFALKMLPVCEPVFASYELTNDFADTTAFDLCYTELTGTIALWIEENGFQ